MKLRIKNALYAFAPLALMVFAMGAGKKAF
jgi:hypothetical protein